MHAILAPYSYHHHGTQKLTQTICSMVMLHAHDPCCRIHWKLLCCFLKSTTLFFPHAPEKVYHVSVIKIYPGTGCFDVLRLGPVSEHAKTAAGIHAWTMLCFVRCERAFVMRIIERPSLESSKLAFLQASPRCSCSVKQAYHISCAFPR